MIELLHCNARGSKKQRDAQTVETQSPIHTVKPGRKRTPPHSLMIVRLYREPGLAQPPLRFSSSFPMNFVTFIIGYSLGPPPFTKSSMRASRTAPYPTSATLPVAPSRPCNIQKQGSNPKDILILISPSATGLPQLWSALPKGQLPSKRLQKHQRLPCTIRRHSSFPLCAARRFI